MWTASTLGVKEEIAQKLGMPAIQLYWGDPEIPSCNTALYLINSLSLSHSREAPPTTERSCRSPHRPQLCPDAFCEVEEILRGAPAGGEQAPQNVF
ncbi:hypothetical protein XENTR_v10002797 [Xenopus tropicalis]|nr:hypothetical protein XENTR_v10002797 [Xenopus tropicalis]